MDKKVLIPIISFGIVAIILFQKNIVSKENNIDNIKNTEKIEDIMIEDNIYSEFTEEEVNNAYREVVNSEVNLSVHYDSPTAEIKLKDLAVITIDGIKDEYKPLFKYYWTIEEGKEDVKFVYPINENIEPNTKVIYDKSNIMINVLDNNTENLIKEAKIRLEVQNKSTSEILNTSEFNIKYCNNSFIMEN